MPEWALEPMKRFMKYGEESHTLLHMSMRGILVLRGMPRVVEVLAKVRSLDDDKSDDPRTELEEAQKIAKLAETENERRFPLLHAHSLIGMWAAFEASVEDMLVGFLINDPNVLENDVFRKIRIRLGEFELLEKEERMRFLLSEFERNQSAGRKQGVDRFEMLLEPFGLSGAIDAEIKKNIREMHHIRNVLVHRAGKADRRIVEGCPWLGLSLGQNVTVSPEAMSRYEHSLVRYMTELIYRCGPKFGVDLRPSKEDSEAPMEDGTVRNGEMA